MPLPFEIKSFVVDAVSWTPLVAPIPCTRVNFRNADSANDLKIRTAAADASTEDTVPGGVFYQLHDGSPEMIWKHNQHRSIHHWKAGDTICYLQTAGGVGPVIAHFQL